MITITSYRELMDFVIAFGQGHLNMLVMCSRGGLGKSEAVQRELSDQDRVDIAGHETPLDLYRKMYEGRDKLIVFDEIDDLLATAANVGLLKQICETRTVKRVQWGSTDKRAHEIDGGIGHFHTRSRVCLLCNSFALFNSNVAALKSRGLAVQFLPSSQEILDKIKTFAGDTDILQFLDHFHECIPEFSLRTYGTLEDLKRAGLDWSRYAIAETNTPAKLMEIADLLCRFDTDVECVKNYSGSRRDYYNWKPQAVEYLQRQSIRVLAQKTREPQSQDAA